MEQPRFGGVALPPLSTSEGEGKSPESVTNTMESTRVSVLDLQPLNQDRHSKNMGAADPDVQRVLEVLHQLGISPHLERHKLKHERQREKKAGYIDDGVYCKNLLLKDRKGQAYLILCGENDTANLHVVKYHLNVQGNLHFASKESMWSMLRVLPGAVSPLALVHSQGDMRIFMDMALMKTIDPDLTKLYFHPLRAELQVGLTFSELKTFLCHCNVSLEMLPSLTTYSARRSYKHLTGGCHFKFKPEHKITTQIKDAGEQVMSERMDERSLQQPEKPDEVMDQADDVMDQADILLTHQSDFFQQLGVRVQAVPANKNDNTEDGTLLPCRSVYLKDKRDNYFLFICHRNQKLDFSMLKMQLKPKKKIVPLDKEALWSLLHLHEDQEHPFALAQLKQPRFLVAISDNLYQKKSVVLTFPHPSYPGLCLEIALKHLETFINNTTHDLVTIQMKGNIEQLQAIPACPSSSEEVQLNQPVHHSEIESEDATSLLDPDGEENSQHLPSENMVSPWRSTRQGNNLFCRLTAPLREWIRRCIRNFVQLLNHYLPSQVSAALDRSWLWNWMLTPESSHNPDCDSQNKQCVNRLTGGEITKMAKIVKLQQLIENSGIQVDLTKTHPHDCFLGDDMERCKVVLLEDKQGQLFIVLCTEEDHPSPRNLRLLRTFFRPHSSLHVANDASISHHLSWPENPSMSWTQDELSPLALLDLDPPAAGYEIHAGLTGALYSFPGRTLSFHLPPLGVALQMSSDDLEKLLKRQGFCIVYLP